MILGAIFIVIFIYGINKLNIRYTVSWKNESHVDTGYIYLIVDERTEKLDYTLDGKILIWAKDFEVNKYYKDEVQKLYVVNTDDYFTCDYEGDDLSICLEIAEEPNAQKTNYLYFTLHVNTN